MGKRHHQPKFHGGSVRSIQRRDKTCWLCTGKVQPNEATRDHLNPASEGGYDKSKNYRLAHRECNIARSNLPYDLTLQTLASIPQDSSRAQVQRLLRERYQIWMRTRT